MNTYIITYKTEYGVFKTKLSAKDIEQATLMLYDKFVDELNDYPEILDTEKQ